jgi:aspartate/methionine/tyrosine aminotransferase
VFSTRIAADLAPNRLAQALERARSEGRPIIDLTESNPTRAGFNYPPDLLAPLAHPRGLTYAPQPFGLLDARRAVAADYARRGVSIAPDCIVLTASTSEAYSLLFKLLCDPGDEVLVPRPSYPLFEHLTRLDAVAAKPYDLEYHGAWSIDIESVERAFTPRTRGLLVVNPNNPTGSFVKPAELDRMAQLCAAHQAAIIADEVFADYELAPGAARGSAQVLTRRDVLAFSLGGLSKSIGLPQAKLGWIGVGGSDAVVGSALDRLELACDTYLSVSTPVQAAATELLDRGAFVRRQIQPRVAANYRHLIERSAATPACRVLGAEGGWYAVVQVPSLRPEEELVLDLLTADRVLAHPGYFFDFPRESYLVVSLLVPEPLFAEGVSRVLARSAAPAAPSSAEGGAPREHE